MTDSPSWNRVKKVFQTALEQQPVDRAAFVRRACEEDPALFGEVESLLAAFERADAFIERPVLAALTPSAALAAGQAVDRNGRALQPGAALGQYEVIEFVGAGGMGEVYRARDRRLNRDVALKIRSGPRAFDADRLERLTREAHLLAALNHPNNAAIYGLEEADGVQALVLEHVEGPTLAQRIDRGPIPITEALTVVRERLYDTRGASSDPPAGRPANLLPGVSKDPPLRAGRDNGRQ